MKQVAAHVGVSIPAVAQALHGSGGNTRISDQMRLRIVEAAESIGYRPNSMARATRTGRTRAIALVLGAHQERSNLPLDVQDAICASLTDRQMHLVLSRMSDEDLTSERTMPRILHELVVDGLLVNYTHGSPLFLNELIDRYRIPAIWLNHKRDVDCVFPDDFDAGRQAAEHLITLGHRRITMADFSHAEDTDRTAWHYSVGDRFEGYAAAMRRAGLEPVHVLRPAGVPLARRGEAARAWMARTAGRPTAVITYLPDDAMMLMLAAAEVGLSVPGDLSLVSFSEHHEKALGVPLTIMAIPAAAMGRTAVDMVLRKVNAPTVALKPVQLAFEFDPGATSAPPTDATSSPGSR